MEGYHFHKNSRYAKDGFQQSIYRFLVTDSNLRTLLGTDSNCGPVTFFTCAVAVTIIACAVAGLRISEMNKTLAESLEKDSDEKMPRKQSLLRIKPVYDCVYKHLRHRDLFQENIKKTLTMEQLKIENICRDMSTICRLLEPNDKTQWRRSRSRKEFSRAISPEVKLRDEPVRRENS
ncbi:uncharacterized protein LOC127289328 isoform X1 [Leptopilina boulardi]|uniref:uncharacterized protein LOC127289328 isoform X1 n=1 Tax=Leptopilina boulardi TaxID=63433 RepID=UPI0021F5246F|nr:uncharacterized protein LOC127289328 isoform X1 [Leptopilina boulardi]